MPILRPNQGVRLQYTCTADVPMIPACMGAWPGPASVKVPVPVASLRGARIRPLLLHNNQRLYRLAVIHCLIGIIDLIKAETLRKYLSGVNIAFKHSIKKYLLVICSY